MRISISTQGGSFFFRGVDYTAQFAERANKYIKSEQKVVDSFKAVKQSVYRMNGGVGVLSGAVEELDQRIAVEEKKLQNAKIVVKKHHDFIELCKRIDREVAEKVNANKEAFYKVNPWARPPRKKKWYEKVWDALCGAAKKVYNGVKKLVKGVISLGKKVAKWAADTIGKVFTFIKDNWKSILKIAASALIIAGLVVVSVFAPPAGAFIAACGLVGIGGKMLTSGITTMVDYYRHPEKYKGRNAFSMFADTMFDCTVNGAVEGIVDGIGIVYGPAAQAVSGLVLKPLAGGITGWANNGGTADAFFSGAKSGAIAGATDLLSYGTGVLSGGISAAADVGKNALEGLSTNMINDMISDKVQSVVGQKLTELANTGLNSLADSVFGTDFFSKNGFDLVNIDLGSIGGGLSKIGSSFGEGFSSGMQSVGQYISDGVSSIGSGISEGIASIGTSITDGISAVGQGLSGGIGNAVSAIGSAATGIGGALSAAGSAVSGLGGTIGSIGSSIAGAGSAISSAGMTVSGVTGAFGQASQAISEIGGAIGSAGSISSGITGAISSVIPSVSGISGAISSAGQAISGIGSAISPVSSSIGSAISSAASAITGIGGAIGSAGSAAAGISNAISGLASGQSLGNISGAVGSGLLNMFKTTGIDSMNKLALKPVNIKIPQSSSVSGGLFKMIGSYAMA